ncbi:hypothetical protein [Chitinophaga jiangningensis]|uniref:hypothetical protein n=1 Tax=Chitinophaga jiangningensis TaxID=1419482 RepID=UPI000932C439|nr:hypothetical protein [Chitinophaga jiangningensis]
MYQKSKKAPLSSGAFFISLGGEVFGSLGERPSVSPQAFGEKNTPLESGVFVRKSEYVSKVPMAIGEKA